MTKKDKLQKWEQILKEKLGLLERCHVLDAYMQVISWAVSQSDVEVVHDLLPETSQVFGNHLRALREVRRAMFQEDPQRVPKSTRPSNDVMRRILKQALNGYNLTPYYLELLDQDREVCAFSYYQEKTSGIHSFHRQDGLLGSLFTNKLFGREAQIGVNISEDSDLLGVIIMTWANELAAEWVYQVLQNQALASSKKSHRSMDGHIHFWFELEAEEFIAYLAQEASQGQKNVLVAQPGFTDLLEKKMLDALDCASQDFGPISPILPPGQN